VVGPGVLLTGLLAVMAFTARRPRS
jgi:hypothetical protein